MNTKIEFRVRPVTRYIVTRFEQEYDPAGACASAGRSTQHGEFESFGTAYAVSYALCKSEHDRLGYPPGDERISYPEGRAETVERLFEQVQRDGAHHYSDLNSGDFLAALGDDAMKWAHAFNERFPSVDVDDAFGWFANAIEHSGDVRRGRLIQDAEAFTDHVEDLMWQRRFFRDVASGEGGRNRSEHPDTLVTTAGTAPGLVEHMVNRFLAWKLPEDFRPDGGIQFDPDGVTKLDPRNRRYEPNGTNLLDARQAKAMVRYMLEGL